MTKVDGAKPSSGSGSERVYTVEARLSMPDIGPVNEGGMLLDGIWRHVYFAHVSAPIGVPNGLWNKEAARDGYVSHDCAMALAWWFLAQCKDIGIEARIVEHEYAYSHICTRKVEGDSIKRGFYSLEQQLKTDAGGNQAGTKEPAASPSASAAQKGI